VCLQEVRAQVEDIQGDEYWPENYHCFHAQAVKRGYSGVAIFTKKEPESLSHTLGIEEFDEEGRYIECGYKDFNIASAYFPSGSSGDIRQEAKYRFLDFFEKKPPDVIFIYSSKSAKNLFNLINKYSLLNVVTQSNLMCISEKVLSVLKQIKWKKVFVFSPGEEEFLLNKIR